MAREEKIRMKFEVEDWEFGMTGSGHTELVFQDGVEMSFITQERRQEAEKRKSEEAEQKKQAKT